MSEELYRVEELCTTGWEVIASNLTRHEATERVNSLMNEGCGPNRLKVIREK
jgi:hypothetical protein